MENKPLVSVIMGIYNCADTLEEAVNCVINQTFTDWELIMCDDCSTDNTYQVALNISKKDSRIIVLHNDKNMTLAPTLNKCAKRASGKYIARMDGDDICPFDRFQKEFDFLENNPEFALVSGWMELYDGGGTYRIIEYTDNPDIESFARTSQFCHAGCMMRKDVFDSLKGYDESSNRKGVEDYDLWVRMYINGFKGYNIQEVLYSMRDDRNAQIRRNNKRRFNEIDVQKNAIKGLNLSPKYYIYPLITFGKIIIPTPIHKIIHKKK